jgi:hypothetical protein
MDFSPVHDSTRRVLKARGSLFVGIHGLKARMRQIDKVKSSKNRVDRSVPLA